MNIKETVEQLTRKDFFYCFDSRLSSFLNRRGHRHIVDAIHSKSNKQFLLYLRTEELTKTIDMYHKGKIGSKQ